MTKTPAARPATGPVLRGYDFDQSIGYWVILAAQAYQKAINNELAPHGITFRQSQVLAWLALDGESSQAQLAARLMIEPPTLVGVLDRMERDGLITRVASSVDRRCKLVRATADAQLVWDQIVDCAATRPGHRGGGVEPE